LFKNLTLEIFVSNGCCTSTNHHQVIRERWVGSKKKPSHNKGRKISKQITTAKTVSSTGLNGKKNALHSLYFFRAHIVQFKVSQHANHSFVVYTTKTVRFPGKISRKVHVLFFVSSDDAVQDFLGLRNLLLSFINLHARITPSSTT
jgi:hypothetical protein